MGKNNKPTHEEKKPLLVREIDETRSSVTAPVGRTSKNAHKQEKLARSKSVSELNRQDNISEREAEENKAAAEARRAVLEAREKRVKVVDPHSEGPSTVKSPTPRDGDQKSGRDSAATQGESYKEQRNAQVASPSSTKANNPSNRTPLSASISPISYGTIQDEKPQDDGRQNGDSLADAIKHTQDLLNQVPIATADGANQDDEFDDNASYGSQLSNLELATQGRKIPVSVTEALDAFYSALFKLHQKKININHSKKFWIGPPFGIYASLFLAYKGYFGGIDFAKQFEIDERIAPIFVLLIGVWVVFASFITNATLSGFTNGKTTRQLKRGLPSKETVVFLLVSLVSSFMSAYLNYDELRDTPAWFQYSQSATGFISRALLNFYASQAAVKKFSMWRLSRVNHKKERDKLWFINNETKKLFDLKRKNLLRINQALLSNQMSNLEIDLLTKGYEYKLESSKFKIFHGGVLSVSIPWGLFYLYPYALSVYRLANSTINKINSVIGKVSNGFITLLLASPSILLSAISIEAAFYVVGRGYHTNILTLPSKDSPKVKNLTKAAVCFSLFVALFSVFSAVRVFEEEVFQKNDGINLDISFVLAGWGAFWVNVVFLAMFMVTMVYIKFGSEQSKFGSDANEAARYLMDMVRQLDRTEDFKGLEEPFQTLNTEALGEQIRSALDGGFFSDPSQRQTNNHHQIATHEAEGVADEEAQTVVPSPSRCIFQLQ